MKSSRSRKNVLGRKPPLFTLGDAVVFISASGVLHGVVIAVAYFPPDGCWPIDADGKVIPVDDWFYQIFVYESTEQDYWKTQRAMEERGMAAYYWYPERELECDHGRRVTVGTNQTEAPGALV